MLAIHAWPNVTLSTQPRALFSLFHHLFPVLVLSIKIPSPGRLLKESVKVLPSETPATAYDTSF